MALFSHRSRYAILRKVVRVGGDFVCGICREHYDSESEAWSCLQMCWQEVLASDPVVTRPVVGGVQYRCRFCSRDYTAHHEALVCAEACRHKQQHVFEHEKHLAAQNPGLKAKRQFVRRQRLQLVPVSRKRAHTPSAVDDTGSSNSPQEIQNMFDVQSSVGNTTTAGAVRPMSSAKPDAPADDPQERGSAEPAPDNGLRRKIDFKDPFYRNGAKYLCRFCNAPYFTKNEVETCFNNHFDANGYEIVTKT